MKNVKLLIITALIAAGSVVYAQDTPVPTTTQPQQQPVVTDPSVDRKADFNSPQTPNRQPNVPSEDTLIKGQKSSGVIMQDSLTPSSDRKADRMNRKKNRKGTAETDDSTSTGQGKDPAIKP